MFSMITQAKVSSLCVDVFLTQSMIKLEMCDMSSLTQTEIHNCPTDILEWTEIDSVWKEILVYFCQTTDPEH